MLTKGDPRRFKKQLYDLRKKYLKSETSTKQKIFWASLLTLLVAILLLVGAEIAGRKIQRNQFVAAYLRKQQQGSLKNVVVGGKEKLF